VRGITRLQTEFACLGTSHRLWARTSPATAVNANGSAWLSPSSTSLNVIVDALAETTVGFWRNARVALLRGVLPNYQQLYSNTHF